MPSSTCRPPALLAAFLGHPPSGTGTQLRPPPSDPPWGLLQESGDVLAAALGPGEGDGVVQEL